MSSIPPPSEDTSDPPESAPPAEPPWWREAFTLAMAHDLDGLASSVAFNAVFSLGPLISLALTLMVAFDADAMRAAMHRLMVVYAPETTHPFFLQLTLRVAPGNHPFLAVFSFIVLLWTSSSVGSSLLSMMAHVRDIPRDPFVHVRLRAIVLGAISALGLGVIAVVVGFGPRVAGVIQTLLGYKLPALFTLSALWVRLPIAVATFTGVAVMYFRHGTLPHVPRDISFRGGLTTGVLVGVATALLSLWLTLSPRFGGGYGASTAFFGVLLWLYAIGAAFVLGACVVRVFEKRRAADGERDPPLSASPPSP